MSDVKTCTKCGETKPVTEFAKHYDGTRPDCRSCRSVAGRMYRAMRAEASTSLSSSAECRKCGETKPREMFKTADTMCKACDAEKARLYRSQNKEKVAETRRAYYEKNKQKIAGYQKRYRDQNEDALRQYRERTKCRRTEVRRKYREKNREIVSERQRLYDERRRDRRRLYFEQNKARIAERNRQYYERYKDRINERGRRYYHLNKEKIRLQSGRSKDKRAVQRREWYERNRDAVRDYHRRYRAQNRDRVWAYEAIRRARKRSLSTAERFGRSDVLRKYGNTCYLCGVTLTRNWHADHVIPISRGGEHSLANMRPSCPPCNMTKHARMPDELPAHMAERVLAVIGDKS